MQNETQQQQQLNAMSFGANLNLDLILKLLQIIYYVRELNGVEEARIMSKKFDPIITDIMARMDKQMADYIRTYGEL